MTVNSADAVRLIPWDPLNESQFERMKVQQEGLGWFPPAPSYWKDQQFNGVRSFFWVVISDDHPDRHELIHRHLEKFPNEFDAIMDTAPLITRGVPRQPRYASFIPIGHVGVSKPSAQESAILGPGVILLSSLYISWALQSSGLGSAAVAQVEQLAVSTAFGASATALETITTDFQMQDAYLEPIYDAHGSPRPRRSNVEWYSRLGYEVIPGSEHSHPSKSDLLKGVSEVHLLYMLKQIDLSSVTSEKSGISIGPS